MPKTRDSEPPLNSFVVRFWREPALGEGRWRGQVLHIQSGESATFADEDALMSFMRRWVRLRQGQDEADMDAFGLLAPPPDR